MGVDYEFYNTGNIIFNVPNKETLLERFSKEVDIFFDQYCHIFDYWVNEQTSYIYEDSIGFSDKVNNESL